MTAPSSSPLRMDATPRVGIAIVGLVLVGLAIWLLTLPGLGWAAVLAAAIAGAALTIAAVASAAPAAAADGVLGGNNRVALPRNQNGQASGNTATIAALTAGIRQTVASTEICVKSGIP